MTGMKIISRMGLTLGLALPFIGAAGPALVTDVAPPSVSLTAPADGTSLSGKFTVTGTASDDRSLAKLELYLDGKQVARKDCSAKAECSLSKELNTYAYAEGSRGLVLKAYDKGQKANTSVTQVNVTFSNPAPVISITSPVENAVVGGMIWLTGTASSVNELKKGLWFIDGKRIAGAWGFASETIMADSQPIDTKKYKYGTHTVAVEIHDKSGNVTKKSINLTFNNPPLVRITSPAYGSRQTGRFEVTATAAPSVKDHPIKKVKFYVDGALAATDTRAPHGFSWDTAGMSGAHALVAKAYDSKDNVGSSAAVSVEIVSSSAGYVATGDGAEGAGGVSKTGSSVTKTAKTAKTAKTTKGGAKATLVATAASSGGEADASSSNNEAGASSILGGGSVDSGANVGSSGNAASGKQKDSLIPLYGACTNGDQCRKGLVCRKAGDQASSSACLMPVRKSGK